MNHLLTLFVAPEVSLPQATMTSPPALREPAGKQPGRTARALKLMAGVVANAAGFGLLLAGCWFSLQLMQLLMT